MTSTSIALCTGFAFLFCVSEEAKVTFTSRCQYTVWPATQTGSGKKQLSETGFQLTPGSSNSVALPSPWSGRFLGRTGCFYNNKRFCCATGECASGQVECQGASTKPPVTLVEIKVAPKGGQDSYDVSNVKGFNLPVSVTPQGGRGECRTSSCPKNINTACPSELQVKGTDGSVIGCYSACLKFNTPQYCCTVDYNTERKCTPTKYSENFKKQCPNAYSYAYDDKNRTFTCIGGPDYLIKFCP